MENEVFSAKIGRRSLHFTWILDVSGSMEGGGKIAALNEAVDHAVRELVDVQDSHPEVELRVRALYFAEYCRWHTGEEPLSPKAVAETWRPLHAIPQGVTETGLAIQTVIDDLDQVLTSSRRHVPPALVLVSDGKPTRYVSPSYEEALAALEQHPLGGKAVRIAIGIGRDADEESLAKFTNLPGGPLRAQTQRQLVSYLKFASTSVAQGSIAVAESGELYSDDAPEVPVFDAAIDEHNWDEDTL